MGSYLENPITTKNTYFESYTNPKTNKKFKYGVCSMQGYFK